MDFLFLMAQLNAAYKRHTLGSKTRISWKRMNEKWYAIQSNQKRTGVLKSDKTDFKAKKSLLEKKKDIL